MAKKYPLGYVLMGIADGKVIFQPKSPVFEFDPANKVVIKINEVQKTAQVMFLSFKILDTRGNEIFFIDNVVIKMPYMENVPVSLPLRFNLPNTQYVYAYAEIIDIADKVFVVRFTPNYISPR